MFISKLFNFSEFAELVYKKMQQRQRTENTEALLQFKEQDDVFDLSMSNVTASAEANKEAATDDISMAMSLDVDGYKSVQATGNPQQDAQNFAQANNITVAQAKNILSAKFGAPEQPQAPTTNSNLSIAADESNSTSNNPFTVSNTNDEANSMSNTADTNSAAASNTASSTSAEINSLLSELSTKEAELLKVAEEMNLIKASMQEKETVIASLTKQLNAAQEAKESAEKEYDEDFKTYNEKIAQAKKDAQDAYENQEVEEGQQPKSYNEFYNELTAGLKMPILDVRSYESTISATITIINSYKTTMQSEQDRLTDLNSQAVSLQTEIEANKTQLSAIQQADSVNETSASNNTTATNAVSNTANSNNTSAASNNTTVRTKVEQTNVPPTINDNVITFGNGRTVKLTNGETAKLSDDGKSVVITRMLAHAKSLPKDSKVTNYQYDYTRVTYDINGNPVEELSGLIFKQGQGFQGALNRKTREFDEYGNVTVEYSNHIASSAASRYVQGTIDTTKLCNKAVVTPKEMTVYEYDDSGRVTGSKSYEATYSQGTDKYYPGTLLSATEYEYNDCENKVTKITKYAGTQKGTKNYGKLTDNMDIEEIQKDDKGRVIKESMVKRRWGTIYDNGKASEGYVIPGNQCYDFNYGYGTNPKNSQAAYIYEYEYDENDNLVSRTCKMPNTRQWITGENNSTYVAGYKKYEDKETSLKFLEDKSVLVYKINFDENGEKESCVDNIRKFNFAEDGYGL